MDRRQELLARKAELQQNGRMSSLMQAGQSIPGQLVLGIGDEALSLGSKAASTISQKLGGPPVPDWEAQSSGPIYDAARFGTNMLPYLLMPTTAAESVGAIAGPRLIAAIERIAGSGGLGYLTNPENPEEGGKHGLMMGGLGEALGPVVSGAWNVGKKGVNALTGDIANKELPQAIKRGYENARDKAWEMAEPYFDKFGSKRIALKKNGMLEGNPSFDEFENAFLKSPSLVDYSSRKFKTEVFDKYPTINNAKKMITQLKSDIRDIQHKPHLEDIDKARIDHMTKAKDALEGSMLMRMSEHARKASPDVVESIAKDERMIKALDSDIGKLGANKKMAKENAFDIDRMKRKAESLREGIAKKRSENLLDVEDIYPKYLAEYAREVGPYSSGKKIYEASQGNFPSLKSLDQEISEGLRKRTSKPYANIHPEHQLASIGKQAQKELAIQSLIPDMIRKYTPGNESIREWVGQQAEKYGAAADPLIRALIQSQSTGGY